MKKLKTFEEYDGLDSDKFEETTDYYNQYPKGSWIAIKNGDVTIYGILISIEEKDTSSYGEFADHTCQHRITYKTINGYIDTDCLNNVVGTGISIKDIKKKNAENKKNVEKSHGFKIGDIVVCNSDDLQYYKKCKPQVGDKFKVININGYTINLMSLDTKKIILDQFKLKPESFNSKDFLTELEFYGKKYNIL